MTYDAEKAGKNQNEREERRHREEHQQESQGIEFRVRRALKDGTGLSPVGLENLSFLLCP